MVSIYVIVENQDHLGFTHFYMLFLGWTSFSLASGWKVHNFRDFSPHKVLKILLVDLIKLIDVITFIQH